MVWSRITGVISCRSDCSMSRSQASGSTLWLSVSDRLKVFQEMELDLL